MSNVLILHKCVECGAERMIQKGCKKTPKFTGLCYHCNMARLYEQRRNRPINQRPTTKRSDGYLEVHLPENHWCRPMATKSKGSILVHRLVMAEHLGRLLEPWEIVHHVNGIKDDNRPENFELTTKSQHPMSYEDGYIKGFKDGITTRDKGVEKQLKLLRWQILELTKSLQIKLV